MDVPAFTIWYLTIFPASVHAGDHTRPVSTNPVHDWTYPSPFLLEVKTPIYSHGEVVASQERNLKLDFGQQLNARPEV